MPEIRLVKGVWQYDEQSRLGRPGGFGEVFRGSGEGNDVAIKRLSLTATAAAHREMKIAGSLVDREHRHIVPVLDYGQDAESDRYFLVMPVCDGNLEDHLGQTGPLTWSEIQPIVLNIVAGLREAEGIVHRDMKPGNVLLHQGIWKIADFGIAKFVEDSTSLNTLREALTPTYAAPEQWLGERPTRATDVYALGCILHRMINGCPPFLGDLDAVRSGHLNSSPPELSGVPDRLKSLIVHMLRKVAASRPSLERCGTVLETIEVGVSRPAHSGLAAAAQIIAQQEAADEAKRKAEEAARRERQALGREAIADLRRSLAKLFEQVEASSESARRSENSIVLGPAHLSFTDPDLVQPTANGRGNGWDVVASCMIGIRAEIERYSYADGSHYSLTATLCYCKTEKDPEFRWREIAFWSMGGAGDAPFSLMPISSDFHTATSRVLSSTNIAYGPWTIDAEDEEAFHDRWLRLFTKAVGKQLRRPMQMPPPATFFE